MRLSTAEEKKINGLSLDEKKSLYKEVSRGIVDSPHDFQLILSGPGTGKTTIFKDKISKWNEKGLEKDKILITSFVNYIVDDLINNLPKECKVYTLHKLAKIIIYKYLAQGLNFNNPITKDFNIAWECDELNICEDLRLLEQIEIKPSDIKIIFEKYFQTLYVSKTPVHMETYIKLTSFYDVITFEDSIARALKALYLCVSLVDFEKIIVDEYQDFNVTEQRLVKLLFDRSRGGIISGDDDQSIYSTRLANPLGLLAFVENKKWEKKTLPFCVRCKSQYVVEASIDICRKQKNTSRQDKTFLSLHRNDVKIKVVNLKSSTSSSKNKNKHFISEAEYIAKNIDVKVISEWKEDFPAYLVLGKTGSHLEKISEELQKILKIKVGIKESTVYDNREVQILFSYIQLLNNNNSNIAYRRLIGILDKKNKTQVFLKAWVNKEFNSLGEKIIDEIKTNLKKIKILSRQEKSIEDLLWNFTDILSLDKKDIFLKKYIDSIKSLVSFEKIIKGTEDFIVFEKERERKEISSSPVQCLTIWGSKGLKANTVFVLGLEEGYLPKSNKEFKDEEVRLMYVAMTRAVEDLHLLFCSNRYDGVHSSFGGTEGAKKRSIFLDWIKEDYIEKKSLSKNDLMNMPSV